MSFKMKKNNLSSENVIHVCVSQYKGRFPTKLKLIEPQNNVLL